MATYEMIEGTLAQNQTKKINELLDSVEFFSYMMNWFDDVFKILESTIKDDDSEKLIKIATWFENNFPRETTTFFRREFTIEQDLKRIAKLLDEVRVTCNEYYDKREARTIRPE